MASTQEIFKVVGKVVLEGMDAVEKSLDSVGKKAATFSDTLDKNAKGLGKNIPKDVMKPVDDSLDKTAKKMSGFEKATGGFKDFVTSGFGIGLGMKVIDGAMGVFDKVGGTLKNAVFGMNSTLETSTLQFETLMGSADDAKKHVAFLFEFAKKTPFETEPIINASKLMQTFGGNALNTEKNLTLIGDAAAATNAPIDELGMWTGRLYAALQAGKPFGDASARLSELAVLTPQARQKMEDMQKAGKSGDEIFAEYQKTLGRFTGAMEKQAGTWQGLTGTFSDTVNIVLAKAGKPFFDMAGKGLAQINTILGSDAFSAGAEKFAASVSGIFETVFSSVGKFATEALPKILQVFGLIKDGITTFVMALQGNWTDAPGIVGFHVILGKLGTLIRTEIIPAILNFKDFIINQVVPALGRLKDFIIGTVVPAVIQFKDDFIAGVNLIGPAIVNFVQAALPKLIEFGQWFAGEILPRAVQYVKDVANVFQNIMLPAIMKVVQAVLPVLQDFGNWFINDGLPKIKQFVSEIIAAWDEIEPKIVPAVQAIYDAVVPVLTAIINFIHEHSDAIKYWFDLAWGYVSNTIGGAIDIIKNVIKLALDIISGNWKGAWDDIVGILEGALRIIYGIISPAITIITDLWQSLMTALTPIFNNISSLVTTVWTTITTTITTAMNAIQTVIQTVMGAIQTVWSTIWNAIQVVADTVWRAIETVVRVEMALVQTIMEPILNAISELWTKIWDAVQKKVEDVWNFINNNIITPVFNTIKTFIETTLTAIGGLFTTWWTTIQTGVETTWNAISTFLTTIWNTIKSTAETTWNAIKTAVTTPITEAQTALDTAWTAIKTAAETAWNALKETISRVGGEIKTALMSPFESARDGIGNVMEAFKKALLSPLQKAIDGLGEFVSGIKNGINSISSKLGLGDIITSTWSGSRISQLAQGTKNFAGGTAIIGEKGIEAAKLPDGTIKLFTKPSITNLPKGTMVWDTSQTQDLLTTVNGTPQLLGYSMSKHTGFGRGGVWSKIGELASGAVDFAKNLVGEGAGKAVGGIIDKLGIPSFPGEMSGFGGKIVTLMKDMLVKSVEELINLVKDKIPADVSTDGGTPGPPGTINGVSGDHILSVAKTIHGVRNWCEKFVGDVFAASGARYARAKSAFDHSNMQATTPGTGPTGAPVFTGFAYPGDVAISMGNGMVYGTEGNGPNGAGPFRPYSGARYTLNPAANGLVANRPMAVLAGETNRSRPEIVSPVSLMAETFRNELAKNGNGMTVHIHVTANSEAEGYAAGQGAAKGFRDRMLQSGFNS